MGRAEILKAALELPAAEREQLADDLWASLHGETEAEVEQAWESVMTVGIAYLVARYNRPPEEK